MEIKDMNVDEAAVETLQSHQAVVSANYDATGL